MTVRIYPNGTGGALGDELVTETQLYTTGVVYFVHHTGDNANSGQIRQRPWASLVFALTQAVTNDIIVLLDGHTETIASKQTLSQNGLKVVGEGAASGNPTVTLTFNVPADHGLVLSGIAVTLGNIRVAAGSSKTLAAIHVTGVRSMIRGCRFEVDATDGVAPILWAADGARLFNTTIVSVATTGQPGAALEMDSPAECEIEACTIDGGTSGFGFGGIVGGTPARLRAQQMRLLNGGSVLLNDGTLGYVGIAERTGGSVVTGFPNRLSGGFRQTGDPLLADSELYMSGFAIYVHYGTGDDANSGKDELAPKKTITGALSVTGDECYIIVCLPGHDEPLAAGITAGSFGVTIIGCGTSSGKPSCRLHGNVEGPITLLTTGAQCYFRNLWFDQNTVTGSNQTRMVLMSQAYSEMRGCWVTVGYRDQVGVEVSFDKVTVRDTRIESAGTAMTTRPARGLYASAAKSDIELRGLALSNGTKSFTVSALDASGVILTRLYTISLSLLFGADVKLNSGTTGMLNPETASGSASIGW